MNDLTLLFSQRIPWDRGFLQRVTDRIEYERPSPSIREKDTAETPIPPESSR